MKVLVTGASGFLGGHVAELLSKRGDRVRALVRSTSKRKHLESLPNVELFDGAVEDVERLDKAVDGVDAVAVGLRGQHQAATHDLAIEPHGAGAAHAVLATEVRALHAAVLAQEIDQVLAALDLAHDRRAVDLDAHAPLG